MMPSSEPSRIDTATALRLARKRVLGVGLAASTSVEQVRKVRFWYDTSTPPPGGASRQDHLLAWAVKFGGVRQVQYSLGGPGAFIVSGAWVIFRADNGNGIGTMAISQPAGTMTELPSKLATVVRGPYVLGLRTPSITTSGSLDPWTAAAPRPGYRFLLVPLRVTVSNVGHWVPSGGWFGQKAQVVADGQAYEQVGMDSMHTTFEFEIPGDARSIVFVLKPPASEPVTFTLR